MGTNLEGRLIALEIERKRLSERLERALADIADLKQFRRTAPGLSWNGGASAGTTLYYAVLSSTIDAASGGAPPSGSAVVQEFRTGSFFVVDPSATVYNFTPRILVATDACPVVRSGSDWAIVSGSQPIGVVYIPGGISFGASPPTAVEVLGSANIYIASAGGYTGPVVAYVVNPFARSLTAGWYCVAPSSPASNGWVIQHPTP